MTDPSAQGQLAIIRPETEADYHSIHRVVAAAFAAEPEVADLVERIRASPGYEPMLALVALIDGEVVGHVMVSQAQIHHDSGLRPIAMLSPLAVDPAFQKRGIGGQLVRAVTDRAAQQGETTVILEGSPTYYGRFGFRPAAEFGMTMPLPEWAPPEAAQLLPLAGFDAEDPTLRGAVVYPPPFDGLD